jgi:hypothetical protein
MNNVQNNLTMTGSGTTKKLRFWVAPAVGVMRKNMNNIFCRAIYFAVWVLIVTFISGCDENPTRVELGMSTSELIEVKGTPLRISKCTLQDKIFTAYFYQNPESSYVVDSETDMVCELGIGRTEGFCYPGDYSDETVCEENE